MSAKRCAGTNCKGQACKAFAIKESKFCYWHANAGNAARAGKRGGKNRNKPAPLAEDVDLSTPTAQLDALELMIRRLLSGEQSVNVTRTVIYAVATARAVYESDLEQRVEALEAKILR